MTRTFLGQSGQMFNLINLISLVLGPPLTTPRWRCQAGLVTYPNKTQAVVVAGGIDSNDSEIWFLDETSFKSGPLLPQGMERGASVPFGNSFLIVGAYEGGTDEIYTYDVTSEEFVLLPQKLVTPRETLAAFMVPEYFC